MVKKKSRRNHRKISEKNYANHSHEQIVFALFIIFVVLSVIAVLNTAPEGIFNKVISGFVGKDILLDKTSYNGSEMLKGTVVLSMDPQDIIPGNATLTFSILTNASKCPTKYVCYDGSLVDWHVLNSSTGNCDVVKADPEGYCCSKNVVNCTQIILNHDFDAGLGTGNGWTKSPTTEGVIGVEQDTWNNGTDDILSNVAFEDSSQVTSSLNTTLSLKQSLSTRAVLIGSLVSWVPSGGGGPINGTDTNGGVDSQEGQNMVMNESYQSLIGKIAWQSVLDKACAFEIVVKSNSSRNLHYYYNLNSVGSICYKSASANSTDIYLTRTLDPIIDELVWHEFRESVYKDWKTFPSSGNDYINEIQILSYRKKVGDLYGQRLLVDNIDLRKGNYKEMGNNCTALGKKCCAEETGFGSYLGEQLNCPENYECWFSCTNSTTSKLSTFISKSSSSGKSNKTTGDECQAYVDGDVKLLHDPCYPVSEGGVGKGYTACLTNTSSGTCFNWDNTYRVNFSSNGINLRAPNQNGSYTLKWKFEYLPVIGEPCLDESDPENPVEIPCLIFEKTTGFNVGSVSGCEANWTVINVSECVGNAQTVLEEDMARCPENAPSYRRNSSRTCGTGGCTPSAYQCYGNLYQQCSQDGLTWNNITDCGAQSQLCDINQNGCYTPCTPNCEGVKCNEPDGCGGICTEKCGGMKIPWMIIIIAALVVIAIVVVLLLVLGKKKPKIGYSGGMQGSSAMPSSGASTSQYPEVVSYIKDAVAAGAGKPDIKAKLLEAGWPDEVIAQSFKDCGM